MLGVCFLYLGLLHRKWNVQFRVLMRYAFPGSFFSLHSRDSDAQPCQIKWKQTKRKLWNVWVRSCPCCCQDIVRDFSLLTFRCQRKRQPQKKKKHEGTSQKQPSRQRCSLWCVLSAHAGVDSVTPLLERALPFWTIGARVIILKNGEAVHFPSIYSLAHPNLYVLSSFTPAKPHIPQ